MPADQDMSKSFVMRDKAGMIRGAITSLPKAACVSLRLDIGSNMTKPTSCYWEDVVTHEQLEQHASKGMTAVDPWSWCW